MKQLSDTSVAITIILTSFILFYVFTHKTDRPADGKTQTTATGDNEISAVCESINSITYGDKPACSRCPPYTNMWELEEPFILTSIIDGSFTEAGKTQKLVDTDGCEPHSNSFGGAILLEKTDKGKWRRLFYQSGIRAKDCLTFRTSEENELLICNEADTYQGQQFGMVSVLRISSNNIRRRILLEWYADEENNNAVRLIEMTQTDVNTDAIPDLTLTLSMEGEFLTRLQELEHDKSIQSVLHLHFLYQNGRFEAPVNDKKRLRLLADIIRPGFGR